MIDVKQRYQSSQTEFEKLAASDGMFLCLLAIAENERDRPIDLLDAIQLCKARLWIRDDYSVKDFKSILAYYTGYTWHRIEAQALTDQYAFSYILCKWNNLKTGSSHYRRQVWDTQENSEVTREGKIIEYHIYVKESEVKYA